MNKFFLVALICSSIFLTIPHYVQTAQTSKPTIKLYVYPGCPYCSRVVKFLKDIDQLKNVKILDANQPEHYKDLVELSGGTQVPFLHDEPRSVKMLESKDIIKYFRTRFN
ncbi:MAG TPA: glutathione S-transferase N-terminal domain-containing protein [Candidatus Saccharimonadales bacterium]|nr:glutathione S-transferase N-terminal domain-containing protein [Candidatus Saccharimonadales bacterium]